VTETSQWLEHITADSVLEPLVRQAHAGRG